MVDDAPGDGTDGAGDRRESPGTGPDGRRAGADDVASVDADDRGRDATGVDGDDRGRDLIPLDLSSDADDEDDAYVPEPSSTPIEPGDPDLENVLFVVLGAITMVLVILRVVSIPLG